MKSYMCEHKGQKESVLRYLRVAAGLSQQELADRIGLTAEDIDSFERGCRWNSLADVIKMSDYFGVGCSELLKDDLEEVILKANCSIQPMEQGWRERSHARQEYRDRIGRAGEEWVVRMERQRLEDTPYAAAVNPNYAVDEQSHFDILSFAENGECIYIEVKTTAGAGDQPIFLSSAELHFAERCLYEGKRYELHRVSYVEDPLRRHRVIYTAQEILERFERTPRSFVLCEKQEAVG